MRFCLSILAVFGWLFLFGALNPAQAADSKVTDLVVFPSTGGVLAQVRGTGAYAKKTGGDTVVGKGKRRVHFYDIEALYGVHDYFAAGLDIRGRITRTMTDKPQKYDGLVWRRIKPGIVVAGNLLGANNGEPVSAVLKVRFAPKWVSLAPTYKLKKGAETEMAEKKVAENEGFPKTNDIEATLSTSYAINSDISVGVELNYFKELTSKEDRDKVRGVFDGATAENDPKEASSKSAIIEPDLLSATVQAQYGIQDKVYVRAGAMYHQQMSGDFGTVAEQKIFHRLHSGINVLAGVAVPVSDNLSINAGASYQVWTKVKYANDVKPAAGQEPKKSVLGWRARLVASF